MRPAATARRLPPRLAWFGIFAIVAFLVASLRPPAIELCQTAVASFSVASKGSARTEFVARTSEAVRSSSASNHRDAPRSRALEVFLLGGEAEAFAPAAPLAPTSARALQSTWTPIAKSHAELMVFLN